jgi:hypothetical protein
MGIVAFILGRSGTGKSYSMRNFEPDELGVVNVQGKILPFRGSAKMDSISTDQSDKIMEAIRIHSRHYKSIVVDDFQYVMANEFMRRSSEKGYEKFTEIARHAWDIVNMVRELPADVIVYVMCHTDTDQDGTEKIKTIGKLLDEKICLEGMSTIVLKTNVSDGQYTFLTQNNGSDTVKSPAGMFSSYAIDNDLKYVDTKIRNYYGFDGAETDEEVAKMDEEVSVPDIQKPEAKPTERKRRRKVSDQKEEESKDSPEEKKEETPAEQPERKRRQRKSREVTAETADDDLSDINNDDLPFEI